MENKESAGGQLITVVIPVYKVEAYLDRCIESVRRQTYKDWEMILVDDGSPDACGEICDGWAKRDGRIRVIHRENGGLSAARNSGIGQARGQWLVFLDSDDWWEDRFLEEMLGALQRTGTRLCICGWALDYEEDPSGNTVVLPPAGVFSARELLGRMYEEQGTLYVTAWNRLIDRSLWGDLTFPEGKIHEDEFTAARILELTDRICLLDRPLYHYVQRRGSITNAGINPRRWDRVEALLLRYQYFREKGYEELLSPALRSLIHHYLSNLQLSERGEAEDKRLGQLQKQLAVLQRDKVLWKGLSAGERLALTRPGLWRALYRRKHGKERKMMS